MLPLPLRRLTRLLVAGAAALLLVGAAASSAPASAATRPAATSSSASSYIEGDISNPVVGTPAVPRPRTKSCTVSLANDFSSNDSSGNAQNFTGTYTPPKDCPGPWAKVVLDFSATVAGRQYDRSASIEVGNTTIWFGTTEEPDPDGLTWHTDKDVTQYESLLRSSQSFSGGIGNYLDSDDNGIYYQTATLTFYEADRANPAPAEPDDVVGVGSADVDGSAGNTASDSVTFTVPSLPRNTVRAELEIYIKGNGCDEQWFSSVPNSIYDQNTAWFCANGPYREVDASIDGTRAGAVQYYPYIYSGGIVPTLWRPIPAIGTFNMAPAVLDVTPLAADLDQSGSHTVTLTVPGANDVWNLMANLLLYTDKGTAVVTGGLTRDTVAPAATQHVTTSEPTSTTADATTTATRQSVLAGWVQTSRGRVTTTVTSDSAFRNAEQVTLNGLDEDLQQTDTGSQTTRTTGAGQDWTSAHRWSYPLNVTEDIGSYTDDNNYALAGTVRMGRDLVDTTTGVGIAPASSWSDDQLSSAGEQDRSDGNLTEADGRSAETWTGSYQGGVWRHQLASDHGIITENQFRLVS
ncbi:MAG TPA: peptide-N4-asparagine amidase [Trebonia sp.]|jgi:hypothetical protein